MNDFASRLEDRARAFDDAGLRYGVADLLTEAAERLRAAEAEAERNAEGWSIAFHAAVSHQEARERLTAEVATLKVQVIRTREEWEVELASHDAEVAAKALEDVAEKLGENQSITEGEVREGLLAYAAAYRGGAGR
ncbi:hypothetical protein SCB71_14540 [Herbiconiux sp. KACC 21604]|uniref:hypothetical protein n=1 Tax=unclassified Herbiconiux TaxID=2618217 RepID=UPI001490C55D|nr:hypothetical protein [Herbiconiux sp. SALV-R1]QJU54361.1 hypothetical protein HL652_12480 [Herbiconiux sp. SALV-R1]WPO85431.1 hypothetical protein SCB71_14540 [Herbiconiux sp. KACC 21604]